MRYAFGWRIPITTTGNLFALRDSTSPVLFSSKEATDENLRPMLTIRYQTQPPVRIEVQE